jgi:drug/metabolite transporter (DMT)-like permease
MKIELFFMMALVTILAAIASSFFKVGSEKISKNVVSFLNKNIIIGLIIYIISTIIYLFLLRNNELSIIYPLGALTYIWILIISHYYFREEMNKLKIFAVFMIMTGIILVTL